MYQLTALYAHPDDPEAFLQHYRGTHAPIARQLEKLSSYSWIVCETLDGSKPPHFAIATLRWASKEEALAALGSEQGQAAVADLANFAGAGVDMEFGEGVVEA